MSQELTVYEKLSGLEAVHQLGEVFSRSGMFGTEKVEQGKVLALACLTERTSPFQLLRKYHLVKGRLTMRADYMLADYKAQGGKCKWLSELGDVEQARARFTFEENDIEGCYTLADAKREGLDKKDNWKNSAPDMLRAALVRKVLRMVAPGIVAGVSGEDEVVMPVTEAAGIDLAKAPGSEKETKGKRAPVVEAEIVEQVPSAKSQAPANEQGANSNETPEAGAEPANVVELKQTGEAAKTEMIAQKLGEAFAKEAKVASLEAVFLADEAAVNCFLKQKGWISGEQTFRDVSDETAVLITGRHKDFTKKAREEFEKSRT